MEGATTAALGVAQGSATPNGDKAEDAQDAQAVQDAPVQPAAGAGEEPEQVIALPPAPAGLAGSSKASGNNYRVEVSNKAGYMCHVHVVVEWSVPPLVPFLIFTHPDNSKLFRDIQRVGARKVIKFEPGLKEVQVEQLGDIKVMWMNRTYSTWLNVVEDTRDPACLKTSFQLLRSDVLGKFGGDWELRAVVDPATGEVVGCRGELHQDVLPKGMPSFMARLPVLGGVLRGISVRAVTRVLDDMNVRKGLAAGRSAEAVLCEMCGPASEAAHTNAAVASFAFNADDAEEDGSEDDEVDETVREVVRRVLERVVLQHGAADGEAAVHGSPAVLSKEPHAAGGVVEVVASAAQEELGACQ